MDRQTEKLLKRYSETLQLLQKEIQALKFSLKKAVSMIVEEDSKVDNELLYNILVSMGQNRVEEFYGKDN